MTAEIAQHQVLDALHGAPNAGGRLASAGAGHEVAAPHAGEALVRRDAHEAVARFGAADSLTPLQVRVRDGLTTRRLAVLDRARVWFAHRWHTVSDGSPQ
jgi:hypothetical protein